MLYRRFPGYRKRRSAHTTSHGRCQVRQELLATPVYSEVRPLGAKSRLTLPACCGAKAPLKQKSGQEEESTGGCGRDEAS